ncbi:MAG: GNAT family N-acetyltransferase [Limnohabitans sp.]|nr:GNAT family N-acetyltransferase [Limnohabitans sp.]
MLPPGYRLHIGSWASLQVWAAAVRIAVFVQEQGIPVAEEWDEVDAGALHAVITDAQDVPIATGRLLQPQPGLAQIGRMAVLSSHRGQHLGASILQALCDAAYARGDTQCVLHAQRSAEGFYRRHGFEPEGEPYDEVGIEHITMRK